MSADHPIAIVIHGGAGELEKCFTEEEYSAVLVQAACAGYTLLLEGSSSIDAVVAAVVVLEDSPLFNAGKGAVLNSAGGIELDAAVMEGSQLRAGAIGAITNIKNPILAARTVMEDSPHVLLVGRGAEQFAAAQQCQIVSPDYFHTEHRREQLKRFLAAKQSPADSHQHGTVGAVALDKNGNLAAATSTGGTTGKLPGRMGDTALIGSGTYADNRTCAVSCTGHGEMFIRHAVAHRLAMLAAHSAASLSERAGEIIRELKLVGGSGGLIAVGPRGELVMEFNTPTMPRAAIGADGNLIVSFGR